MPTVTFITWDNQEQANATFSTSWNTFVGNASRSWSGDGTQRFVALAGSPHDAGELPAGITISQVKVIIGFDMHVSGHGNSSIVHISHHATGGDIATDPNMVYGLGPTDDSTLNPAGESVATWVGSMTRAQFFEFLSSPSSATAKGFRLTWINGPGVSPYIGSVDFTVTYFIVQATYDVPLELTSISPNVGDLAGGETVTLTGDEFAEGLTVNWGDQHITPTIVDAQHMTVVTPMSLTEKLIDVTVFDYLTGAYATLEDGYQYLRIPAILSVTPNFGTMLGGTNVVIIGRGFLPGSNILFGGQQATNIVYVSPTEYHATTPAHQVGPIDVLIVEP